MAEDAVLHHQKEVDWIIKDWPAQWQSPVEKPTTRTGTTQSSKPKDTTEAGSSARTGSPMTIPGQPQRKPNQVGATQYQNGPRRTPTTTRTGSQPQTGKKDTDTGCRRKRPRNNKWGTTLTDNKESRTRKICTQEEKV
jgi:hypothetical protein